MAKIYNVNNGTIINYAKYINHDVKQYKNNKPLFNEIQIKYIIDKYNKCNSRVLAIELNCSISMIKKIWRENNLKGKTNRTYYSDFNYFETIDTEEKAYWLGFIYADGCVYKRNNHEKLLSIKLCAKDKSHLNKFKIDIKSENPINDGVSNNNNYSDIVIVSDKLCNDLISLGCEPKKTFKLNKLPIINDELLRHFIRGFFDGDGSICKTKNNYKTRYNFSIIGMYEFIVQLKLILEKELLIKLCLSEDKRTYNLYSVRTSNKKYIKQIYNYLYENATRYLQRKKDIFEENK